MNSDINTEEGATFFQTSGTLLQAAKEWTSIVENFPYGLGALIFYSILFQSDLVPQWLSVWGLIGAVLMFAMGFLRMFGHPVVYLAIPILLNELVLAVWLIMIGFNTSVLALIIVGLLFIIALGSSFLSGIFAGSMDEPEYLTKVSANENKILIGVLFQLSLTASVVAIPIIMFPILKEYSESLALGYVVARSFEGIADAVMAISMLLLLTLSREFVKSENQPTEATKDEM